MSIKTEKFEGQSVLHRYDLSGEQQLDLTSPPYRLQDGQCSNILGWDILSLNRDRPDRGRRSLGISLPVADRPLTWAEEINAEALIIKHRSGVIIHNSPYDGSTTAKESSPLRASGTMTYNPATGGLSGGSGMSGYSHREGDRVILAEAVSTSEPLRNQGVYDMFTGPLTEKGITSASASVEIMLFQGRGFAPILPGWLPASTNYYLVMSPDEYDANGPWDAETKILQLNEDGRIFESARFPVEVATFGRENDSLVVPIEAVFGPMYKFTALSESRTSMQGILCGNGRKFWLLNGGEYKLLLDLGDDFYLGSKWRTARVASNRIMLVNEKFPPLILHLSDRNIRLTRRADPAPDVVNENLTLPFGKVVDLDGVLAGMIPPSKPGTLEYITAGSLHRYPSWLMENAAGSTSMEAGRIKVYVRLVNIYDNLYSDFIEVVEANGQAIPTVLATDVGTLKKNLLTVSAGDYVTIFHALQDSTSGFASSLWAPFFHSRATHLEIWRTESIPSPGEGVNYYREALVHLADLETQENDRVAGAAYADNYGIVVPKSTDATKHQIKLANANLVSLPILTDSDFSWGRLPPVCRDVVSLGGVTLCLGKASSDQVKPTIWLRDYFGRNGSYGPQISTVGSSYRFDSSTGWTVGANWTIASGKATHTPGSTATLKTSVTTPYVLLSGFRSIIRYQITGRTAGSVSGGSASGVYGPLRSLNGAFEEDILPVGDDSLEFVPTSDFNGSIEFVEVSGILTQTGLFTEYAWKEGDVLEVFDGGIPADQDTSNVPRGRYRITAKISNDALSLYPLLPVLMTQGVPLHIHFCIARPHILIWPSIGSDEEVWYSRPDVFQPEGFSNRVLSLSRNGDIFRRAVKVGNFAAVVMEQGVHLVYVSGVSILKETVEDKGAGTPWEDSVAVVGNSVIWACAQGVRILKVSAETNVQGNRAELSWLTDLRFESWFLEAANNGETVDTGVDTTNQILRFRRFKGNHVYQVLQYSLRTQRWTLLDDDNGLRYASTRYAESETKALPVLYTVDATGAALEVNLRNRSGYPGSVVQSLAPPADWEVTTTLIRARNKIAFSSRMVGDVVRFRSSDPAVGEVVRTILTAGDFKITFDAISGLSNDPSISLEFLIGAVRFKRRYAPMVGARKENIKTVHEGFLRIRKGETGGNLTTRLYEELAETTLLEEKFSIGSSQPPQNFVLSKTAQGSSIELEMESFDVLSDFEIETVEVTLREEDDSILKD